MLEVTIRLEEELSGDILGLFGEGEASSADTSGIFELEDNREDDVAACEVIELREFEGKLSKDIIEQLDEEAPGQNPLHLVLCLNLEHLKHFIGLELWPKSFLQ